jgi:adenylate cyclase
VPSEVSDGRDVPSAFAEALAAERLLNARRLAALRFVGVSLFFAFTATMGVVLGVTGWTHNDWRLFAAYWAASGVVLAVSLRSDAVARVAGLAIPLLDMPAIFLLQRNAAQHVANPGFIVGATVGFFTLLVISALLTLHEGLIVLVAVIGAVLAGALQQGTELGPGSAIQSALTMLMAAVGGAYGIRRIKRLVADVSAEQVRRARLGRYFSPQVAALLAASPEGAALGESREVSVLFADLRDFTAIAERLEGRQVVALLNDFHAHMVSTIFAFGGTLDKYLGDGVMVYFGAPVAEADHAARAVRCALAMQEALTRLNDARTAPPLRMGIGVHTGTVVVGDIGAPERREYTIIGHAVNVASRLQELTKSKGVSILVSEATRAAARDAVPFTAAGPVEVRGVDEPLAVWVPGEGGASPAARVG